MPYCKNKISIFACLFLCFLNVSLYSSTTDKQIEKLEFLIDLKFHLLFHEEYSSEKNKLLIRLVDKVLKEETVGDSLFTVLKNNLDEKYSSCLIDLLQIDALRSQVNIENCQSFPFKESFYPIDIKILNQLQKYTFSRTATKQDDYYLLLALEIHELVELLTGTSHNFSQNVNCVFDSLSNNAFNNLNLLKFHKIIATLFNNFNDAHLSLNSSLTYKFYSNIVGNNRKPIKIIGDRLICINSKYPVIEDCNLIDTIQLDSSTIKKLTILKEICSESYLSSHFQSKFVEVDQYCINHSKKAIYRDSDIVYIDFQKLGKQSNQKLRNIGKKIQIKLLITDLRGYPPDPLLAYKLLKAVRKSKFDHLAILIDKNTYSLCEILACKLDQIQGTVTFGSCSAGAMGESNIIKPNQAFALEYTAEWYDKRAYKNESYRNICPEIFMNFKLPIGYITAKELFFIKSRFNL